MRRPSVLFLNRVYPPHQGATGRILRDLARSFAREGWQVTVITSGPKPGKDRDGGIRVIRVKGPEKPGNAFIYLWILMKMTFVALRLAPTHLLVTMSDPPLLILAGQLIKRVKKNRHINWCHDLYPDIFPSLGVWVPGFVMYMIKREVRQAMRGADKVIVIGRCMAKTLTLDGLTPKQITVIPNWPDFELVNGHTNGKANGHRTNGHAAIEGVFYKPHEQQIKDGPKFRILYAGNIGRAHPVDSILGAAEILNEEFPEIEFVFVGDGPRFDDIARERSRRRLDNIRLMPYQPQNKLREMMESGDVHLISVQESAAGMLVPCKLYSALAVGRPCIFVGPAQSETAKVIGDFNAGVVVHQGQARELAEQIKAFRLNSDRWFEAHHGAVAASKVFRPDEAINAWIERAWGVVKEDIRT